MRIIAGEHRGRRIDAPVGQATRPMLDRVREALFGTLGDRVGEARVLDLFAGSGSLGLEALSRGALSARMIERDPATGRILRRNVELLGLADRATVVRGDALDPALWRAGDERFDIVFFDPPYAMVEDPHGRARLLERVDLAAAEHLAAGGVLVLHVPRRSTEVVVRDRTPADVREYGSSALVYLEKKREKDPP